MEQKELTKIFDHFKLKNKPLAPLAYTNIIQHYLIIRVKCSMLCGNIEKDSTYITGMYVKPFFILLL